MVHVRINEREANPNPHINFITVLPVRDATAEDEARQLLRALAAQVRPVMKAHGFVVNGLEEARIGDPAAVIRRLTLQNSMSSIMSSVAETGITARPSVRR